MHGGTVARKKFGKSGSPTGDSWIERAFQPVTQIRWRLAATILLVPFALVLTSGGARADSPPKGSYQQSCNNVSAQGSTLSASCKNRGGGWQQTTLSDYRQCIGDISNMNGSLQCSKGAPPPGGSYKQSCQDIFMAGSTLKASCKNRGGQWVATSLDGVNQCVGDIANLDGALRCSKGGQPPGGSYTRSCRDIVLNGTTLTASCNGGNGQFFNTQLQNINTCRSEISNFFGSLTCVMGTGNAPPGSFIQSCGKIFVNGTSLSATCITRNGTMVAATASGLNACRGGVSNIDGWLSCNRGTGDPPPGSYQQTCINITVSGSSISADCERLDRSLARTALANTGNCSSDISNQNGTLTCKQALVPPSIGVAVRGLQVTVTGSGFKPSSPVTIRIVDDFLNTVPNQQTSSNPGGQINVTFNIPRCNSSFNIHFSATDNRPNAQDATGVLWSNTATYRCP